MGKVLQFPGKNGQKPEVQHEEAVEAPQIKTAEELMLHCLEKLDGTVKTVGFWCIFSKIF